MAIGFVATGSAFSSVSSGTSVTLNKPPGAGDDHLLVAFVAVTGVRTITPPTGWILKETASESETSHSASLFILVKNGSDGDPSSWNATISSASDRRTARVVAYSGCSLAANQFLTDNSNTSTADTPLTRTTPTVNNTDADAWRLTYFVAHDNGVSTSGPAWSTSDTERFDDHVGGTSDPTLTVAGYDSNNTISTGNTSIAGTWTPGGSATSMDLSLTWIGILEPFVESVSNAKASYQTLLNPTAGGESIATEEGQETALEQIAFQESQVIEFRNIDGQSEGLLLLEGAEALVDDFSVTFNDNLRAPGFEIKLDGLQESEQNFEIIEVWRRDPSGRYRDQRVRGLAEVLVTTNTITVTDYEAPLNTILHYYLRLYSAEDFFDFGPVLPKPLPYIPTLSDAYAGGTAYLKAIDAPEISMPLAVEEMDSWSRAARVKGRYEVLGRKNPVVITDVSGGMEGSFSGHCILQWGQSIKEIENILAPGVTLLFQNHNPVMSGIDDFYLKIEGASFQRRTRMVHNGMLDNPLKPEVVVTFSVDYIEVDRPDPVGVVVPMISWNVVNDTHIDWAQVHDRYESWQGVLTNPFGPEGESS